MVPTRSRILDARARGWLRTMVPGIRLAGDDANDQARVDTPGDAIARGADWLVIGRSITGADDRDGDFALLVKDRNRFTRMILASHPFDTVGWDGFVYPFTFNANDFEPLTGTVHLPEGTKMVMPGDNVMMSIELITPVALEEQMRFAIREGGKTVGSGVVTKITE